MTNLFSRSLLFRKPLALAGTIAALLADTAICAPKVVLISLDGATPRLMQQYIDNNAIPAGTGIRLLEQHGIKALQNLTINPSLTAAAHIAIATGSNAAANDVPGNAFRLLATPSTSTFTQSGFGAPIGGYQLSPVGISPTVTAVPIWASLRAAGKTVVTATWPGGDGVDVRVPGLTGSPIIQPASERTVDLTIPFGTATSPFQKGFELTSAQFSPAPAQTVNDLTTAGHVSFSPILQKTTALETFTTFGQSYNIQVAALDTTNDSVTNYDKIVIFDTTPGHGGIVGPFTPAPLGTGPAVIKPGTNMSALFLLEGNTVSGGASQKAGTRYFVSNLAPNLSTVRVARTSMTFINRSAISATVPTVTADVDDMHNTVGFWAPQPDFRIVEKLDAVPSTFANFPDIELEAIYEELVDTWTVYQRNMVLRALSRRPNADLAMFYIEQPDGSGHQFFINDPRQCTSFTDNTQIYGNQDASKKARYASYLEHAYVDASNAVQSIIAACDSPALGGNNNGLPDDTNIIVTSDHGFETFHTAVQMNNLLSSAGVDLNKIRVVTTGPAVNIYIRLSGRTPGETVTKADYLALQAQIANVLRNYRDTNSVYNPGGPVNLFDQVISRPLPADINDATFGLRTSEFIGQDSGDVFATLVPGYNFDGTQTPVVPRQGDAASNVLSLPNFYGAHGYDPMLPNMSAIFYAAGPNITPSATPIPLMANMDIAPTISRILGVAPSATVQGRALNLGPAPLSLVTAASRKTHGAAGIKDLRLAVSGPASVECRNSGTGGSHTLVFTFSNTITGGSASISSGIGSVLSTTASGNVVTVNLTGVSDIQTLGVTLTGITDGATVLPAIIVNTVFLKGDVDGNRIVNAVDVTEEKNFASSGGAVTATSFRADTIVNGAINSSDLAFTKTQLGHSVP